MSDDDGERLGIGGVAQLLGLPRLTVWWWVKSGQLKPSVTGEDGQWWTAGDVYWWAMRWRSTRLAGRVPVTAWPSTLDVPWRQRSEFTGPVDLDGAVALCWETAFGPVRLVWPLTASHHPSRREWVGEVAPQGNGAVLVATPLFFNGPELAGFLPAVPDREYHPMWAQVAHVLGCPVPYWPSAIRDRKLLHEWRPGAPTVTTMAISELDTGALLRMASLYPPADPSNRVLVHLAQLAHQQVAESAAGDLDLLDREPGRPEENELVVAARPIEVSDVEDLDATTRRAGWLGLLARTDALAAYCVIAASMWDGGTHLPYSNPEQIEPPGSRWALEWAKRLLPAGRTAAHQILDPKGEAQPLVDPETDAPAVREQDGTLWLATPQRLPASAPLAELILDHPIWVRTEDGTLWPAPKDAYYGISWGYGGSGPGTLALLVDVLLGDINAQAPADVNGAPDGLWELMKRKMPRGTVLTRQQLEAARRGEPPLFLVDLDLDDGDGEQDESGELE